MAGLSQSTRRPAVSSRQQAGQRGARVSFCTRWAEFSNTLGAGVFTHAQGGFLDTLGGDASQQAENGSQAISGRPTGHQCRTLSQSPPTGQKRLRQAQARSPPSDRLCRLRSQFLCEKSYTAAGGFSLQPVEPISYTANPSHSLLRIGFWAVSFWAYLDCYTAGPETAVATPDKGG